MIYITDNFSIQIFKNTTYTLKNTTHKEKKINRKYKRSNNIPIIP